MKKSAKTIEYIEGNIGADTLISINNKSRSFLDERTAFSFGGKKMNGLKPVGLIEEAHGHKGTVMVRPLNGTSEDMLNLKNVILIDPQNKRTLREVYEVRKYRRGRFLVKFCGMKWRSEIEGYRNFVMAV